MDIHVIIDYSFLFIDDRIMKEGARKMILLQDIIGEKVSEGISLTTIGINEYAWEYKNIIDIISILRKRKIPILGGDVYIIKNGKINTTFDSWYYDNISDTGYEDSYKKTIDYINIFEAKEETYVYSIVI